MTDDHRDNDLRALRGLLETEELSDVERAAFDSMLADITGGTRYRQLTINQREWAMRRCDDLGIVVIDPAERNKDVPRGREVEMAPILRNLPKMPPKRRML